MSVPSKDVLQRMRKNGQLLRDAATELTNRIKAFEAWLGKQPGRVTAQCLASISIEGDEETYLAFRPHGKEWSLVVYDYDPRNDHASGEMLLRDAPVEVKMWIVKKFPQLVEEFAKRQEDVAKRARESSAELDAVARDLGIGEGA